MEYDYTLFSSRLARRPSVARLGAERIRLETTDNRRGIRRQRRGCQPMDAARPSRWSRRLAAAAVAWGSVSFEHRPTRDLSHLIRARGARPRLSGAGVDLSSGGLLDSTPLRRDLPSGSCVSALGWIRLDSTKADTQSRRARRSRHCRVASPRLATGQKKVDTTPNYTLLTVDEAGFYLLPSVVRTYAPCGQTPLLTEANPHPHLSAIAAITPQGQLYTHLQETSIHGEDIVHFLCHLLRHIPGKLVLFWDRAKIHVGDAVKHFLRQGGARDVELHHFPPYAPELNPTEGIWHYLKNVELRNLCCLDLVYLKQHLRQAILRVRQKTRIIKACFKHAGLIL